MKTLIESFDRRFYALHRRSIELVKLIPSEKLFWQPREIEKSFAPFSVGEYILRSAAQVEQTFGGLTTRLWDDPFEWTLAEELSSTDKILEYLAEVEATRRNGFELFQSDEDLKKELPAPVEIKPIFDILLETLCRAEHLQGRAFAVFQMFSDEKLPRL
ncbi:MAG: hypothetical protein M3Q78_00940 [Acidobacteriota bacterium]|nr:hypothetical protein [Acidobacteriota bacterium]